MGSFVFAGKGSAEMAELRMTRLENLLRGVKVDGIDELIDIKVSWGFTDFDSIEKLEQAIASADQNMYKRKRNRKDLTSLDRDSRPGREQHYKLDIRM